MPCIRYICGNCAKRMPLITSTCGSVTLRCILLWLTDRADFSVFVFAFLCLCLFYLFFLFFFIFWSWCFIYFILFIIIIFLITNFNTKKNTKKTIIYTLQTKSLRQDVCHIYVTCRMHAVFQHYFLTHPLFGRCFEFPSLSLSTMYI